PLRPEKDAERNPFTRRHPVGFGDNLDPTNNPAILLAEDAEKLWTSPGPNGRACAGCHDGGPERAMRGVATRYPKFVASVGRVMSLEDVLTVHGAERNGRLLPAQSPENIALTILIKMQSNGMPMQIDLTSPEARAALARGKASFYRRVGGRNHSCADCHTPE